MVHTKKSLKKKKDSRSRCHHSIHHGEALVAQTVKNQSAVQEIRVQSLGQEHPLVKGMATHYSILAWTIPWTEELGGLYSP